MRHYNNDKYNIGSLAKLLIITIKLRVEMVVSKELYFLLSSKVIP